MWPRCLRLSSLPVFAFGVMACSDENRSTFDFSPEVVEAFREPALATECFELDAPNSDDDRFVLKAVEGNAAKLARLWIAFKRRTPRDVELDAYSSERGPDAPSISPEYPAGAQMRYVSKASVTVTDVPTKDGDTAGARFEIEWTNGDLLEGSIRAPVVSAGGPCTETEPRRP